MDVNGSPTISSFVIRFVVEAASLPTPNHAEIEDHDECLAAHTVIYRGSIRHIQSEEELNFNSWDDAVAFIERFVPLDNPRSDSKQP